MKIQVSMSKDNEAQIEVIDPSDGAVAHSATVSKGESYTVTTTSRTPADIEVYGPESTEQAEEPQSTEPKADTPKPKATSTTTSAKSTTKDAA